MLGLERTGRILKSVGVNEEGVAHEIRKKTQLVIFILKPKSETILNSQVESKLKTKGRGQNIYKLRNVILCSMKCIIV